MVRLTGAALGFFAFALTILFGMAAGNAVDTTLERAMQAMFVFFALGLCVGSVGCRVVEECAIKKHRELFPDGEAIAAGASPADTETGVLPQEQ